MKNRISFDIITNKRTLTAMQKIAHFSINSDGSVVPSNILKFSYKGKDYLITKFEGSPYFVTTRRDTKEKTTEKVIERFPTRGRGMTAHTDMYIVIKPNAHRMLTGYSQDFIDLIKSLEGKRVPVNTDYLFQNSFNIPIVSDSARKLGKNVVCTSIPAGLAQEVINDARKGRKRCNYCGRHSVYKDALGRTYQSCPYCKHTNAEPFITN